VEADGSGDAPTIAAAYLQAVAGDTIELGNGSFREFDLVMKGGVHLVSRSGNADLTAIDALGTHRCLIATSIDAPTEIVGITFKHGSISENDGAGGLVLIDDSHVHGGLMTFRNCSFMDGSANSGGAVAVLRGNARFEGCRFENNAGGSRGGAIAMEVPVEVVDCRFWWNDASKGGAIWWGSHSVAETLTSIRACEFRWNSASRGGAIACSHLSEVLVRIEECDFIENWGWLEGGAVYLSGPASIVASRFIDNMASNAGGAVSVSGQPFDTSISFDGNLFARNWAGHIGGAVYFGRWSEAIANFDRCTFVGNGAKWGGHLFWDSWAVTTRLSECILAFATDGAATGESPEPCEAECCDVYGNAGGDFVGGLEGLESIRGNFSSDPQFCGPSTDDYSLFASSPCLNPPVPCVGPIGAEGQGCGAVSVEPTSWGKIKAAYR
jgi:hypothetical protein